LPAIFTQMPGGMFFGILFFILLGVAALTSAVSLMQPIIAYFADEKGWNPKFCAVFFGLIVFLLGVPSSLSLGVWSDYHFIGDKGFLDSADYIASNILLPLGGVLISVFVGWAVVGKMKSEVTNEGEKPFRFMGAWLFICRFIAPVAVAWILISGL